MPTFVFVFDIQRRPHTYNRWLFLPRRRWKLQKLLWKGNWRIGVGAKSGYGQTAESAAAAQWRYAHLQLRKKITGINTGFLKLSKQKQSNEDEGWWKSESRRSFLSIYLSWNLGCSWARVKCRPLSNSRARFCRASTTLGRGRWRGRFVGVGGRCSL